MAAIDYKDLTDLLDKIENNGETDDGVLRADEFVKLVNNVIVNERGVKSSVKKIKFGASPELTPDSAGLVVIPTEAGNKIELKPLPVEDGYDDFMSYLNSRPQFIYKGSDYTVKLKVLFRELIDDTQWPINDKLIVNFYVGEKLVGTSDIYDYELNSASASDDKKIVSFNFSRYFQPNSYNTPIVVISDPRSRVQEVRRPFPDVYYANITVSTKLIGTVNNLSVFDNNSLTTDDAKINIDTSVPTGKLAIYEKYSKTDSRVIYETQITDTSTSIPFRNAGLSQLHSHGQHTIYSVLEYTIPNTSTIIKVPSSEVSFIYYNKNTDNTDPLISVNKAIPDTSVREYAQLPISYLIYLHDSYSVENASDLTIRVHNSKGDNVITKVFDVIPEKLSSNIVSGIISITMTNDDKNLRLESGTYTVYSEFEGITQSFTINVEKSPINVEDFNKYLLKYDMLKKLKPESEIRTQVLNIWKPKKINGVQYNGWQLFNREMEEFRKKAFSNLSGGQKQRVAIAGVIAFEPDCLVLDEPTAMLDPNGRKEVIKTLHELNEKENVTVLLITHYMEEAEALSDRIGIMTAGKLLMVGTARELMEKTGADRFENAFISSSVIIKAYKKDRFSSSLEVMETVMNQLGAEFECAETDWRNTDCIVSQFAFNLGGASNTGWAVSSLLPESKGYVVMLCYSPTEVFYDLEQFIISCVDSICIDYGSYYHPGPITSFAFPKGENQDYTIQIDMRKDGTMLFGDRTKQASLTLTSLMNAPKLCINGMQNKVLKILRYTVIMSAWK